MNNAAFTHQPEPVRTMAHPALRLAAHQSAPVSGSIAGSAQPAPLAPAALTYSYSCGNQSERQQLACLYTKHKTQKRKIWHDGRLVLQAAKAILHDAHPAPGSGDVPIGECELTGPQRNALAQQLETRLEMESYLIQVEGPWVVTSTGPMAPSKPNALVSQGMQKVMTRKFRKPGSFVPEHPAQQQVRQRQLGKRQRAPLQPGELRRRYYGEAAVQQPVSMQTQAQQGWSSGPPGGPQQSDPARLQTLHASHQSEATGRISFQSPPQQQRHVPSNGVPGYQNEDGEWSQQQRHSRAHQRPTAECDKQSAVSDDGFTRHGPNRSDPPNVQHTWYHQQETPVASLGPSQGGSGRSRPGKENQNQRLLAKNAFDPSSFFGEEEESDDGVPADTPWMERSPVREDPASSHRRGLLTSVNNDKNESGIDSSSAGVSNGPEPSCESNLPQGATGGDREGTLQSRAYERNNATLSTTELLNLFGGGSQFDPTPASEDRPQGKETKETLQEVPAEKTQQEKQFEFVLPPASDSSSDEADEN